MNQWVFLLKKVIFMFCGLFVFGTGSYLGIQANIGLGAWEAFQTGVSDLTGISYGNVSLIVGAFMEQMGVSISTSSNARFLVAS